MSEQEINTGIGGNSIAPIKNTENKPITQVIPDKVDLSAELKSGSSPADIVDFLLSKSADDLIPWEDCVLPSQGIYYNGAIPGGKVQVKAMTLTTDKILSTARLTQSGQALEHVYKRCIRLPNDFDPVNLLAGDRVFLLFYIRGITHGNKYEFVVTCSNESCKRDSTHEYDLNQIGETIQVPKYPKEPVPVRLPYFSQITKREVIANVRFMRGQDTHIMAQRKQIKDQAFSSSNVRNAKTGKTLSNAPVSLDETIEANLNLLILDINGESDKMKIAQLVGKMHASDTAAIREFLRENSPGIDTEIKVVCPSCETEMTMELPITETFFRPKNSGGLQ